MNRGALSNILSALGGAALVFFGQVAFDQYKAGQERAAAVQAARTADTLEKRQLLDTVFREFRSLEALPARAGEFIISGRGGSKQDVGTVAAHFLLLCTYLDNDRVSPAQVRSYYGGIIPYWRDRFRLLADGMSPVSSRFTAEERQGYSALVTALDEIDGSFDRARNDNPFREAIDIPRPRGRGR